MKRAAALAGLLCVSLAWARADAQEGNVLAALAHMPADERLWDGQRYLDVVDLDALKQATGVAPQTRLAAYDGLSDDERLAVDWLLLRFVAHQDFRDWLKAAAAYWEGWIGVDLLQARWFVHGGSFERGKTLSRPVMAFGGAPTAAGAALSLLPAMGLAVEQRGGIAVWAVGEDYGVGQRKIVPGFPFWGGLLASVRLFRSTDAVVGARGWAELDLALAVELGEAESLADLPRYRLAVAAAGDPALSAGAVMQMTFADLRIGHSAFGLEPSPSGLPPYGLYAIADREDATGTQVILVLTVDDGATAAEAGARLLAKLRQHRDPKGNGLADHFPELDARVSTVTTAEGSAAVVRLATPRETGLSEQDRGLPTNRSRLYGYLFALLAFGDIAYLAPQG